MDAKMIFLTLFSVFSIVQGEIHDLRYIYTALSKPSSQPGVYQFSAMGILDDRPIDFYNSEDKVKKPMQKWMEEHNDKDYWDKGTQSRRSKEQWFDVNVKILMERMHHNKSDPDVHILQWMHGCVAEKKPDGSMKFLKGFDQYAYDSLDFLSFDTRHMSWVAPAYQAESTKRKWDNEPILSQYTKGYLETDCVYWLDKFVKLQDDDLETLSPPEVHIFAKKSIRPDYRTLVCLATGFFPPHVMVDILKNGQPLLEWDGIKSSGVLPNGDSPETYQLRKWLEIEASDTSKYICRIQHKTLKSPIEAFWDGKCSNCDSGSGSLGAIVGGIVVLVIVLAVVAAVILFVRRSKKMKNEKGNDPDSESEILRVDVVDGVPAVKSEKKASEGSLYSDSGKGSSNNSSEDVSKPLVGNAEGEQQPQPEASEAV